MAAQATLAIGQAVTPTGTTQAPTTPTDPLGPSQAPDELAVLTTLAGEQPWVFNGGDAFDQTDPLGRGAFTEEAVIRLHAIDPNFGHIRKDAGQKQYNGHAIDAVCYKRADGVTAESIDILTDSGPQWLFQFANATMLGLWYF